MLALAGAARASGLCLPPTSTCDLYHSLNVRVSLASDLKMRSPGKIVSAFIALLITVTSVAAVTACPQGMPEMGRPQSPMTMMGMTAEFSITASQMNLCCQIGTAEIAPVPVRASGDEATLVPVTFMTPVGALDRGTPNLSEDFHLGSPPAQDRLCVFLI